MANLEAHGSVFRVVAEAAWQRTQLWVALGPVWVRGRPAGLGPVPAGSAGEALAAPAPPHGLTVLGGVTGAEDLPSPRVADLTDLPEGPRSRVLTAPRGVPTRSRDRLLLRFRFLQMSVGTPQAVRFSRVTMGNAV